MNNNSLSIHAELIRRLFVLFPKGTHVELAEKYIEVLSRFEAVDLAAAIETIIKTREKPHPPSVAELSFRTGEAFMERLAAIQRERRVIPEVRDLSEEELRLVASVRAFRKQMGFCPLAQLREHLQAEGFEDPIIKRYIG